MNKSQAFDRCIILHGCPPNEEMTTPKEKRWMNWLASELRKKGFSATAPDLPTAWQPLYQNWKKEFEKYPVTKNTVLVGHSCGAAFLVRWLLETGKVVKKLILVAPAKVPETDTDSRKDLYDFDLSGAAPHLADEIVLFTSNDFPHHLESLALYIDALKPRIVELENKRHFLFSQMGTNEFPELLAEILSTTN
jgi:predicted alpha/beta hydrolase family esterase